MTGLIGKAQGTGLKTKLRALRNYFLSQGATFTGQMCLRKPDERLAQEKGSGAANSCALPKSLTFDA
jgi:hypothetical protein